MLLRVVEEAELGRRCILGGKYDDAQSAPEVADRVRPRALFARTQVGVVVLAPDGLGQRLVPGRLLLLADPQVVENGVAVVLTDHGNLFGAELARSVCVEFEERHESRRKFVALV